MNGGKLIQDCSNHAMFGTHPIFNYLNKTVYEITSTHHQMQYPYNLNREDYTIVAVSHSPRSLDYEGDGIDINNVLQNGEPEIILYHKDNMPKCLAIQGHPEYMRKESPIVKYLNSLIDNTIKTIKNNENN